MQEKLIAELEALIARNEHSDGDLDKQYENGWDGAMRAVLKVIRGHEAEQGEGLTEDSLEAWENEAAAFYEATGYLRPGKDPGTIGDEGYRERRDKAWKIWSAGWCYRNDHPTPAEPTEPLAVLADRKGYDLEIGKESGMGECADHWGILLKKWVAGNPDHKEFHGEIYAQAEQAARAYLEGLPTKAKEAGL